MTQTETVAFDVGGQLYKISRSLLHQFPESMLAKSASEQWLENPESEIFIERDGTTFRHILSYLRDGSVILPVTEPKESFLKELLYYGIEARSKDVHDGDAKVASIPFQLASSFHPALAKIENRLRGQIKQNDAENYGYELALFCIRKCFEGGRFSEQTKDGKFYVKTCNETERILLRRCRNNIIKNANQSLHHIGLKVAQITCNNRSSATAYLYYDVIDPRPIKMED